MNKTELIKEVATLANLTNAEAEAAIVAFTNIVTKALKDQERVSLLGFGTFETVKRAARVGRNPKTGEEIKIAATVAAKFKAGKFLKHMVSGKPTEKKVAKKATKAKKSVKNSG